jgi:propionate CoA-transferase
MHPRIFRDAPMGLDHMLLGRNLSDRVSYDSERNLLFVNFEGYEVRTIEDVDRIGMRLSAAARKSERPSPKSRTMTASTSTRW